MNLDSLPQIALWSCVKRRLYMLNDKLPNLFTTYFESPPNNPPLVAVLDIVPSPSPSDFDHQSASLVFLFTKSLLWLWSLVINALFDHVSRWVNWICCLHIRLIHVLICKNISSYIDLVGKHVLAVSYVIFIVSHYLSLEILQSSLHFIAREDLHETLLRVSYSHVITIPITTYNTFELVASQYRDADKQFS